MLIVRNVVSIKLLLSMFFYCSVLHMHSSLLLWSVEYFWFDLLNYVYLGFLENIFAVVTLYNASLRVGSAILPLVNHFKFLYFIFMFQSVCAHSNWTFMTRTVTFNALECPVWHVGLKNDTILYRSYVFSYCYHFVYD